MGATAASVNVMRIIVRLTKGDEVRFVSHLDIQRLLQRAFRRGEIPLAYSNGFNPHPQMSFATALSTGYTSDAEWVEVKLDADMTADEFIARVNPVMPKGFAIGEAMCIEDKLPSLTALLESAEYELTFGKNTDGARLTEGVKKLLSNEIIVDKRTKGGMKKVDIRPQVFSAQVVERGEGVVLVLKGALTAAGSMNVELFMGALSRQEGIQFEYSAHRRTVSFSGGKSIPV